MTMLQKLTGATVLVVTVSRWVAKNIHVAHYLKDCISWGNKRSGVDSNYNPGFKMRNIILITTKVLTLSFTLVLVTS